MDFRIEKFDEVTSTNDVIKECIDIGEPEGLVALARKQTGGYGRRGNPWMSPEGGLYMSVLLRPEVDLENLPTLPHAAAIAIRRAIVSFLPEKVANAVKIKWPNDIVFMDGDEKTFKKICGISAEQRKGAVCLGIGINVRHPDLDGKDCILGESGYANKSSLDARSSKNKPVYLEDLVDDASMLNIDAICEKVLEELGDVYPVWSSSLLKELRDEYMDHFALEGFKARIDDDSEHAVRCEVVGIDETGSLEVVPFGETGIRRIVNGTVRPLQ